MRELLQVIGLIVSFSIFLIFGGCSTTTHDAQLNMEAQRALKLQMALQRKFQEVVILLTYEQEQSVKAGNPLFSASELESLKEFLDDVDTATTYMESVTTAMDYEQSVDEIRTMWIKIKMAYETAYDIVSSKLPLLTEAKRVKLMLFDERAREISDIITDYLDDPDYDRMQQVLAMSSELLDTTYSILKILGTSTPVNGIITN